jgi:hypothetical protein
MTERSDLRRASLLAASGPKAACGKLSTPRPPDPGQLHDACDQALAAFSGLSPSYVPEEATMLSPTTVQSLGQVRLEEMHEQARRAALAKTARRARRAQRTRAVLAGRARRAHRPASAPQSL